MDVQRIKNSVHFVACRLGSKALVRAYLAFAVVGLVVFVVFGASFVHESRARRAEAGVIVVEGGRLPAETRGIMTYLMQHRAEDRAPAFIPQSMWDNSACAAAVIEAANFLRGDHRLRVTDAWTLERDNPGRVRLIYDREASHDFHVGEERITEEHDRTWWFSRLRQFQTVGEGNDRQPARLYILGYRYHRTVADPRILAARRGEGAEHVGVNSHLALLLGRADGEWYVYHFFHRPAETGAQGAISHAGESPFRIDSMSGSLMTSEFDMVRVWEVLGPSLPIEGAPVRIVNPARPYTAVQPYLGFANRFGDRASYFVDTAMMGLFGDARQSPQVVRQEASRSPWRTLAATIPDVSTHTASRAYAAVTHRPVHRLHERPSGRHGTISKRHLPPLHHGRNQHQINGRRVQHERTPRASR